MIANHTNQYLKPITPDDFERVKNEVNGNPRYVCHFLALDIHGCDKGIGYGLSERYAMACKLANKAGGRKYHNKSYGGGIVFQSYSLEELCNCLNKMLGFVEA
jgi:hypothetical protein